MLLVFKESVKKRKKMVCENWLCLFSFLFVKLIALKKISKRGS